MEKIDIIDLSERSIQEDIGLIQKFMKDFPEKALGFGIRVALAVIFLIIGMQLIKLLRKILKRSLTRAKVETGVIQFLDSFVKAILYVILIIMIASQFGLDATSVVAVIGSAGVAVGLALQGSLSNLAGGVLILLLKPFVVGDYIIEDGKGHEGNVAEIQIFYTKLHTIDHKTIILPNGALAASGITNISTLPHRRIDLIIGISYSADLKKAKEVIMNVIMSDADTIKNMEERPMNVFVDELAESSVNIGVRCWVANEDYWYARWRIIEEIKLALDKAEIEIPFQQLDVHLQQSQVGL